jgi:hypothetical protein
MAYRAAMRTQEIRDANCGNQSHVAEGKEMFQGILPMAILPPIEQQGAIKKTIEIFARALPLATRTSVGKTTRTTATRWREVRMITPAVSGWTKPG